MRTATVTYSFATHATVPMLRLRGKWLEQAGFQEGQQVQIHVEHGKLTLTLPQVTGSVAYRNCAVSDT